MTRFTGSGAHCAQSLFRVRPIVRGFGFEPMFEAALSSIYNERPEPMLVTGFTKDRAGWAV